MRKGEREGEKENVCYRGNKAGGKEEDSKQTEGISGGKCVFVKRWILDNAWLKFSHEQLDNFILMVIQLKLFKNIFTC